MGRHEKKWVVDPLTGAVRAGIYAIKIAQVEHGLMVITKHRTIHAILNGGLLAQPSNNASEAFGRINVSGGLSGRPASMDEYVRICTARLQDAYDGHDLNSAIDINQIRPMF